MRGEQKDTTGPFASEVELLALSIIPTVACSTRAETTPRSCEQHQMIPEHEPTGEPL